MKKIILPLLFVSLGASAQWPTGEMPDMSQMFMQQFDENKDGKVTLEEFRKPNDKQFYAIDKNRDAIVDGAEIKAYVDMMMQRMEEMQQRMLRQRQQQQ